MRIHVEVGNTTQAALITIRAGREITRRGIRQGFFSMGDDFMRTLNNEVLRTPKTGRIYIRRTRSGRRRRHRASAPGESHANITGRLRRAADYKLGGMTQLNLGYLDNPPDYDGFVEFGTRRMRPRPTVQNTIRQTLVRTQETMEREIVRSWNEGF